MILQVNLRSKLGGKRVRQSVVVGITEEEKSDPNFSDILLFKTCEKLVEEFGGVIPKEFGFNMEIVSIKDL